MPNLYITAAYMSDGIWNASHYSNPAFDAAAKQYFGAAEIAAQRAATKKMAGFLLRDTPVITDYFITYVSAGSSKVKNYFADGISHVRCARTSLTNASPQAGRPSRSTSGSGHTSRAGKPGARRSTPRASSSSFTTRRDQAAPP